MNIHPLFVHFPIALLSVYVVAEFLRFKFLTERIEFKYFKAGLVILGWVSGLVTLVTGAMARAALGESARHNPLISSHAFWAQTSMCIFGILAVGYMVWFANQLNWKIWPWLLSIERVVIETPLVMLIAIAGFVSLSITGALGGSIVFGPDSDPFTSFIYRLFFK